MASFLSVLLSDTYPLLVFLLVSKCILSIFKIKFHSVYLIRRFIISSRVVNFVLCVCSGTFLAVFKFGSHIYLIFEVILEN